MTRESVTVYSREARASPVIGSRQRGSYKGTLPRFAHASRRAGRSRRSEADSRAHASALTGR
eukprot:5689017-Pleurochrysis_carterae.AAC.5